MVTSDSGWSGRFYGWYVVGALFFATFLVVGTRQGFGVFVETWEEEWGVSVGAISIAASVGWLLNGLVQPFFGRIMDRIGGRPVVLVSMTVMGFAFIAMAFVTNVWMLTVLYGFVISSAAGGISPSMTGVFVVRWFQRKRGTAMSLLVSGGSVGGLVLVPFLTYLFLATNWQTAWVTAGVIALVLGLPLLWWIVRSDPSDMGLHPDGDSNELVAERAASGGNVLPVGPLNADRWQASFRSAPIWQLSLAYWVCGVTTASISVHFVRWAGAEGISPGTAALAFGLLSGINAASVIFIGSISDRMQRKTLLSLVYFVRAAAFVSLIALPGEVALWTFAVVGGGSWLATVPLTNSLTADVYGVRHVGTLGGLILMAHQLGGALAVFLFGVAFDRWGSYDAAFAAGAIALLAAGLLAFTIREKAVSARYAPITAERRLEGVPVTAGDG
ncbi:MAG: MFS transporter [Dehalococcoidia bacterium]